MNQLELFSKPKKAPIFWNICKKCNYHIVRDIEEMRWHWVECHDQWILNDFDLKDEFRLQSIHSGGSKPASAKEGMFVIPGKRK